MEQMDTGMEESKPNFRQLHNVAHAKKYSNYKKKCRKKPSRETQTLQHESRREAKTEQTFQNKLKIISILPEVDPFYVCVQWLGFQCV